MESSLITTHRTLYHSAML